MVTEILDSSPQGVARAGEILRAGGLVAIPTETVYGLAANALDGEAVKKIFGAKGRPGDNPLIAHIGSWNQLAPLVQQVPETAKKLARAFWPGPLTIILEKSDRIPPETSGGLSTVAVRFPSHPTARAVIQAAGVPLAAPSANRSGRPSPTSFAHVYEDMNGRVDAILDGGDCPVGVESTVVSLAGEAPRLLRPGGITLPQLEAVLGKIEVDPAVLSRLEPGQKALSPGMKYQHYAPAAKVTIFDGSSQEFADFVNARPGCFALCFDETKPLLTGPRLSYGPRYDQGEQARRLFGVLHQLDYLGAEEVFAQRPGQRGIGLAVYNRLIRAAAHRVQKAPGPLVAGLVGQSGAGKSTVAKLLEERGLTVIDCDALTRSPQVYDEACLEELRQAFGRDVAPEGRLNRRLLANRAFASPQGQRRLGEITFPRITAQVRRLAGEAVGPVVLDAPTLFEAGLDSMCRRIIAITAPEELRLERVMVRDGIGEEQARMRFAAQQPPEFYAQRADWVVENSGGEDLTESVRAIVAQLKGG